MTARQNFPDSIFFYIVGVLYAYGMAEALMAATVLEVGSPTLLLLCAAFSLLLHLCFYNRYTTLAFLGCLAVTLVVLIVSLVRSDMLAEWFQSLGGMFQEFVRFFRGQLPYKQIYSDLAGWVLTLGLSLITVLNTRVHFGFPLLAVFSLCALIIPVRMNWALSGTGSMLIALTITLMLAKKLNLSVVGSSPEAGRLTSWYSLAVLPVGAAVFLLCWVLPKPELPDMSQMEMPNFMNMADNLVFDMSPQKSTTFSEQGERLGGPISMGSQFVMEVDAEERVYLAGSVRDTYTGSAWTLSDREKAALSAQEDGWYDTVGYSGELLERQLYYMRFYGRDIKRLTMHIGENRTKTVFSPPFRLGLGFSGEVGLWEDPFGGLTTSEPIDRYSSYTQDYISWNYESEYFIQILRTQAAGDLAGDLSQREMEAYLALPEALPDRVGQMARSIAEGYVGDYDRLQALKQRLSEFPYTLEPDRPPANQDFVDYFLFAGQEGYCVYYASALAVMGRCLGIPTRYVEGYVMPKEPGAGGLYAITGQQAHAWAEAYFPGFGWVPVEATPSGYVGENNPNNVQIPDEVIPEPESEQESQPEEESEAQRQPEQTEPGEGTVTEKLPRESGRAGVLAAAAGILFVALLVVGLLVYRRGRRGRMEKLSNAEAVVVCFSDWAKAAKAFGYPMRGSETAIAYASRLCGEPFFQEQAASIKEIAYVYSKAAYSKNPVTDEERGAVSTTCGELVKKLLGLRKLSIGYRVRYLLSRF